MGFFATLLPVVGSLLGANIKKNTTKNEYVVPNYQKIRDDAEAAGFNPLTALTQGPQGQVVQSGAYMGQALADASLMLADSFKNKEEDMLRRENMRLQNDVLKKQLQNETLRPKVGGVYARNVSTPSLAQALGKGSKDGSADINLSESSPLAGDIVGSGDNNLTGPQLAVKKDVPAIRLFGHDFYGSGLFSTGQQAEDALGEGPLQWAYQPVVLGDALLNEAYKAGERAKDLYAKRQYQAKGGRVYTMGGRQYALQPPKVKKDNRSFLQKLGNPFPY